LPLSPRPGAFHLKWPAPAEFFQEESWPPPVHILHQALHLFFVCGPTVAEQVPDLLARQMPAPCLFRRHLPVEYEIIQNDEGRAPTHRGMGGNRIAPPAMAGAFPARTPQRDILPGSRFDSTVTGNMSAPPPQTFHNQRGRALPGGTARRTNGINYCVSPCIQSAPPCVSAKAQGLPCPLIPRSAAHDPHPSP
jgi:hypothetical protein